VSGVEPGREAFKAGLRDGQKVAGLSIYFGDPSRQVRLTVDSVWPPGWRIKDADY